MSHLLLSFLIINFFMMSLLLLSKALTARLIPTVIVDTKVIFQVFIIFRMKKLSTKMILLRQIYSLYAKFVEIVNQCNFTPLKLLFLKDKHLTIDQHLTIIHMLLVYHIRVLRHFYIILLTTDKTLPLFASFYQVIILLLVDLN